MNMKNFLEEQKKKTAFPELGAEEKKKVEKTNVVANKNIQNIDNDDNDEWHDNEVLIHASSQVKNIKDIAKKQVEVKPQARSTAGWESDLIATSNPAEKQSKPKEEMIVVKKAEKPAAPKNWAEKMRETKEKQKVESAVKMDQELFPELGQEIPLDVLQKKKAAEKKEEPKQQDQSEKKSAPKFINSKKAEGGLNILSQAPINILTVTEDKPEEKETIKLAKEPIKFVSKKKEDASAQLVKTEQDLRREEAERRAEEKLREEEEKKHHPPQPFDSSKPFESSKPFDSLKPHDFPKQVESPAPPSTLPEDRKIPSQRFVNKNKDKIDNNRPLEENAKEEKAIEKIEKIEKVEKIEKIEKVEKIQTNEHEAIEKQERNEKTEKSEKIGKGEKSSIKGEKEGRKKKEQKEEEKDQKIEEKEVNVQKGPKAIVVKASSKGWDF